MQIKFSKLYFVFIFLSASVFEASATSCMIMKEVVEEKSKEHRQKINIEISKEGRNFYVSVSMPKSIDGRDFDSAYFYKGISYSDVTKNDYDFSAALRTSEDEKGRLFTYYTIKDSLTKQNTIGLIYGSGCGMSLEYQIDYTIIHQEFG